MSWLDIDPASPFSLANLPFGIISTTTDPSLRPAVAIGDHALDLRAFAAAGGFRSLGKEASHREEVFTKAVSLNAFAACGRPFHRTVRAFLRDVLDAKTSCPDVLKDDAALRQAALLPLSDVRNHLPLNIGDYTDYYAGKHHAHNAGALFRSPATALQPNYLHLPVAYHGRASSIVVSGTPILRPWGQILKDPKAEPKVPVLAPCERLDFELEMGMFICRENELGKPVPIREAAEYVFGYVLVNDWSARDLQAWEYVPLGPFTAKNLGTSISPWVVLADALHEARASGISNETSLLPYLREEGNDNFLDITLEVDLIAGDGSKTTITKTNARNLVWSWRQMIAHHTISGCNLRVGDLLASGTISGEDSTSEGSLLEQSSGGKKPVLLQGGGQRTFLQDNDTVVIRGKAGKPGAYIGFGEVTGKVLPPLPLF